MNNLYKIILIAVTFFTSFNPVHATHLSGLDFSYECVGQDSFLVTLNIYRDCSGVSAPSFAAVAFSNSCGSSFSQNLIFQNPPSGTEVSQLCASSLPNSSCNGGSLPGMQHYIYSNIVVLNNSCNEWKMSWSSCCRNTTVNLVMQPGSYIEATLMDSTNSCNNSPVFNENYIRYVCLNQVVNHTFTVTETDGDSLVYELVSPLSAALTPVPFQTGYSYLQPLPGLTLDSTTGAINFTPSILGNFVVAVRVCEYEYGTGLLKGCVTRDIEYVVLNCSNNQVQADTITNLQGGGSILGPYDIGVCAGNSITFDVVFTDPDTADSINITSNISTVIPGAIISSTGGNPDTVSVSLTSLPYLPPVNTFYISASDDACPINGSTSIPISIHLIAGTYAGPDQTICLGTQWANLNAVGGTQFNWSVLSGSVIDTNMVSPNYNMTCINCQYPQVAPQVTTTYILNSNLVGSCSNSDTVTVSVAPNFNITTPNDTLICSVDDFQLGVNTNQPGSYSYNWSPSFLLDNDTIANPFTNPNVPTTFFVTVTSSAGCAKTDNIHLDLSAPFPVNNHVLGDTVLCSGSSTQLQVGFGSTNYSGCTTSTTGCNGFTQTQTLGTSNQVNAPTQYPAVYGGRFLSAKHQIIYQASELANLGLVNGGLINSIAFDVSSIGSVSNDTNFTIKMGCTTQLDFSNGWIGNLTTVYYNSNYSITTGWNVHNFNVPFSWDGTSNLVVEICFTNNTSNTNGLNSQIRYTATGYQSVFYRANNDTNNCQNITLIGNGSGLSNERPNTQFNFCSGIDSTSLSYSWSPSLGLSNNNIQNPVATPFANNNYQVVVTGPQGICIDTLYHYIDVVQQFDAGFYTSSPYCVNDTLDTLMPNVGGGVFTGNAITAQGVFDPALAGIGIWPINYSITSPAACANDSTLNVEVLALPDASLQYQEVCVGSDSITLIPNTLGGIFSGVGITDSINGVFDPVGLSAGVYSIEYTLTQPCFNTQVTDIKVTDPFTFNFNQNIIEVCQEDTVDVSNNFTLSTDPNQGSGSVQTVWSDNNGYIDSNGVFDAAGVPVGDYIVTLSVSDTNGACGSSNTMKIRVLKKDYPYFPDGLTFCETDGQVVIITSPWLFGVGTSYTQTPITPLSSNDTLLISPYGSNGTFNTTVSGTGSWEFSVSYTNLNNCTGITKDTIYVLPAPTNNNVIQNQTVLTAALGGGYDYQWLDCNNNMAPVPGATNQSFTPPVTGDYAVVISAGKCSITSACYYGWSVGVEQIENELGITIFPNPTHDAIQINKGDNENVTIEVIDFKGSIILKTVLKSEITTIDLTTFSNGVYLIRASSENGASTQKIVKN